MNQTENIGLNKIDPVADGEQYFNVDTHLNHNWEIIDQEISNRPTRDELNGTSQQALDVKSDLNNVSTVLGGNYVASGLAFSTSGITANYTAGIAVVNGVRFSITAGSVNLNANQGQYLYVDTDGTIKSTTTQATADAKCPLWYFSTNATAAIVSTDRRTINVITIDPSQAPSVSVGKIGQFLSWITNRIKAITGKTNWYDAPDTTLAAANTHINNTNNPHNVTATQVPLSSTNFVSTNVKAGLDELFTNVSNGKTSIASAITGMGQSAAGSDTFSSLSSKISSISTDANAMAGDILSGKTAYSGGTKNTGSMPNNGAVTITPSTADQTIAAGYHSGLGKVVGDPDLVASNIKSGVNIFGVVGTAPKNASGSSTTQYPTTTINFGFQPTKVLIMLNDNFGNWYASKGFGFTKEGLWASSRGSGIEGYDANIQFTATGFTFDTNQNASNYGGYPLTWFAST